MMILSLLKVLLFRKAADLVPALLTGWRVPAAIALVGVVAVGYQQHRVIRADRARLAAEASVVELASRLAAQNAAVDALAEAAAARQASAARAVHTRLEAGRKAARAAPGATTPEEAAEWLDTLLQR